MINNAMEDYGFKEMELPEGYFNAAFLPRPGEKAATMAEMAADMAGDQSADELFDWRKPRKCIVCGEVFQPKSRRHKCCSSDCWYKKRYAHRELHHKSEAKRCKWCGKRMVGGDPSWVWGNEFCSNSCSAKYSMAERLKRGEVLGFARPGAAEAARQKSYAVRMANKAKREVMA